MTDEQIENLFNAFEQADSSTNRKYGGTGLGLAITKNLIDLMNGTISINSEYGKGSEFLFELAFEVDEYAQNNSIEKSTDYDTKGLGSLNGARILAVDDNKINQQIVHELLESVVMHIDWLMMD